MGMTAGYGGLGESVELTDAEIIKQSLDEPDLFGVVFTRYHDTILRYVARRQGLDRAPDLTADVFTRAFVIRERYDTDRATCRPWLYGIASNIIGDEIRRQRRSRRLYLAMVGLRVESEDSHQRSEDQLTALQLARQLNGSLAKLAARDRDVLLLYAIEELSYGEIAVALGIPIGTVRSRLARARRKLRKLGSHFAQTDQRETPLAGTQP